MTVRARRLKRELEQLKDAKSPTDEQKRFVFDLLADKDQGIAFGAAKIVGSWGGKVAFRELQTWFEKQVEGRGSWQLYQSCIPFRHFSGYAFDKKDLTWLATLFELKHAFVHWGSVYNVFLSAGLLNEKDLQYLFNRFAEGPTHVALGAIENFYFLPGFKTTLNRLSKHDHIKVAEKAQSFLRTLERQTSSSPRVEDPASRLKQYFAARGKKEPRPINGHHGFVLDNIDKQAEKYFLSHLAYGKIPLNLSFHSGSYHFRCDAKFQPNIPDDSVRADISKQDLRFGADCVTTREPVFAIPMYFYKNQVFRCISCGCEDEFSAEEQKRWYEDYRIPVYATMNRCIPCRQKKNGLLRLEETIDQLKEAPNDPHLLLAEAKLRIFNANHLKEASLETARHRLRQVEKLEPDWPEVLYWHSAISESQRKTEEAAAGYQRFVDLNPAELEDLVRDAKERLSRLSDGE